MKRLLLILALLAAPLMAQTLSTSAEPPKEPQVQKLFVLKHADPQQIASLIKVFATNVTPNNGMHALAVSASKEAMAAIEDAINRLDVPPPPAKPAPPPPPQQDIEMTLYLVVGSTAAGEPAASLPKDLDSVVAQLRSAFAYKSYRLQDVQIIRTRQGASVTTSGIAGAVQIRGTSHPIIAKTTINSAMIWQDGSIRVDNLRVMNQIPTGAGSPLPKAVQGLATTQPNAPITYNEVGITANVDVKEGQKVVVGKSGMSPDEAMFVVLSAKVAQ